MTESKPLTFSPFAGLSGVRYPAHTPRPTRAETVMVLKPGVVVRREAGATAAPVAEVAPAAVAVAPAQVNVSTSNVASVKEMGSNDPEREQAEVGSEKMGKKKRRRRMHDAAFVEKVIAAAKKPGAVMNQVAKAFDVSSTLVSRWVATGVPKGRWKKSEPPTIAQMSGKTDAPRAVKGSSGLSGIDRVVLLLTQSAQHQQTATVLQRQALDELAKLNTALRLVFAGK